MALELSSLKKAVNSMEKAVEFSIKKEKECNIDNDEMNVITAVSKILME